MAIKLKRTHLTFRSAEWPGKTYHARTDTHSYTVDHDGIAWRMRIWAKGVTGFISYQHGASCSALMDAADTHAGESRSKTGEN